VTLRRDPLRGEAEGASSVNASGFCDDLHHIVRNKSYMFSCLGYTCQTFITGALAFWCPTYLSRAYQLRGQIPPEAEIGRNFGITALITGMGIWQGVTTDSLKFHPGPPCPTLLSPVGGPPL
jgi:hypothetical protein